MNTTTETPNKSTETPTTKRQVILGAFGDGRYSPVMKSLYDSTQRLFGFSKEQAHVTAQRFGNDAGQLQSLRIDSIKMGHKVSKDGQRTMKEIVKAGKFLNSWAMTIATIVEIVDDARSQGLVTVELTINDQLFASVSEAATKITAAKAE